MLALVGLGFVAYGTILILPFVKQLKRNPSWSKKGLRRLIPEIPNRRGVEGGFELGWSAGSYLFGLIVVFVGSLLVVMGVVNSLTGS